MSKTRGEACPKPVRSAAKSNKQRAYRQEVAVAEAQTNAGMPAKRVALSGALKGVGLDGDVDAAWYLAECKNYTPVEAKGAAYIRFPVTWVTKIMKEGAITGRPGVVVLQPKGASNAFVVVDRDQFIGLMGRAYKAIHGEDYTK